MVYSDEYYDDSDDHDEDSDGVRMVFNVAPAAAKPKPAPADPLKSPEAVTQCFRSGEIPFSMDNLQCPFCANYKPAWRCSQP